LLQLVVVVHVTEKHVEHMVVVDNIHSSIDN